MKWDSGLPAACDSACIIYEISKLSFPASEERSTSLNDIEYIVSIVPPLIVVALDGVMVLVVEISLP